MITYTIEQEASVELEVYSILGTVVLQIDAGKQNSGSYQLPFDSAENPRWKLLLAARDRLADATSQEDVIEIVRSHARAVISAGIATVSAA